MPYVTLKNGNRIEALDEFTGESKAFEFDTENKKVLVDYGDGSEPEAIGGMTPEQAEELDQAVDDIAQLKIDVARAESKADIAGEVANSKLDNSMHSHTEGTVPVADENGQLVDNYITNDNIATSAGIESSKLAFTSAQTSVLNSGIDATKVAQIQSNADNISLVDAKATHADGEATRINGLIPSEATTSNQLADKAFVNSTVGTNTANFIGTFNSLADLEAYSGTVTNNDYAFVIGTDSAGNTVYKRYKYTDATTPASWVFEYDLNNSSFTAAQWATINSGATASTVTQVETNRTNIVANSNSINTLNGSASTQGSVENKIATALPSAGDGNTIDANTNGKLEAIGLLNANGGAPIKVWEGTEDSWTNYQQGTYNIYGLVAGNIFRDVSGTLPGGLYQPILGYGLGKFYLFGYSDEIGDQVAYTSTYGATWDEGNNLQSYVGLKYVSEANGILYAGRNYSTDGTTWTKFPNLSGSNSLSNVIYADDNCYYVMVGATMYKSTDGVNFTSLHDYGNSYDSDVTTKLFYENGVFVVGVKSSVSGGQYTYTLLYGADPSALTAREIATTSSTSYFRGGVLAYGNGVFIYTYEFSKVGHILYSSDGTNWTDVVNNEVGRLLNIIFFDGYFLSNFMYSSDGLSWFSYGDSPELSILSYAASNTKLIFCGLGSDEATYVEAGTLPQDLPVCYFEGTPNVGDTVYEAPGVLSSETITAVNSKTITLSNNVDYKQSGNIVVSSTVADVHPDWLCNIENVGVKFGNKLIADASGSLVVDQVYDATSVNAQSGVAIAGAEFAPRSLLATVGITGDYDDLLNKPTIPAAPAWGNITGTLAYQLDLNTALNNKVDYSQLSNYLQNEASGTNAVSIGSFSSEARVVSLGKFQNNLAEDSVVIGNYASSAAEEGLALGRSAIIGASANNAIQIGRGTNNEPHTLYIGGTANYTNVNYKLLDLADGLIPDARLSSNIARTADIPVVDQTYSAASANAQSGVAVAQAVAAASSSKSDCFVRTLTYQLSNWTNTTDASLSATYPKQATNTIELLTIPYKASNKVSAYVSFSGADAISGKYAPVATVTSVNANPNQGAQITIYATETPAPNQPTIDVTVFVEYGA